ncbi:MAG: hypothetical protein ACKVTZ_07820, partial [Bacteroidia bacterium]
NVMLTKTCSGCFSCRKSAKTKFLQVIGQLKQPVQHYIYATTKIPYHLQEGENEHTVSVKSLPSGLYLLQRVGEKETKKQKVVVE